MKRILTLSVLSVLSVGVVSLFASMFVSCGPAGAEAGTPAEQLVERMSGLCEQGIMYGHQDDPFYGITWDWEKDRSDTKELTGSYPAVMGFDMAGLEIGDSLNIDKVPFWWIRQEIIAQHERGGIVTLSWHPRNPVTGGDAWDVSVVPSEPQESVVRSILPGGEQHEKFCGWMDAIDEFIGSLVDDSGNAVPVILRPWHEYNGSWFWWGQKLCSDEEFLGLWNMFQDRINEKYSESIVWAFSPNLQGNWTEEEFLRRYPCDDRVDLLGQDCYQWGSEEDFIAGNTADIDFLTGFAADHGLLFAVTECGMQNSPVADWWSRVFLPTLSGHEVCYFLAWRNFSGEHFGASKDATTAEDFKALAESGSIMLLDDIL